MSAARPIQCLLSRGLTATGKATATGSKAGSAGRIPRTPRCHHAPFHSSSTHMARRKPRFKSLRAEEMGLITPEKIDEFTKERFPQYTPEELEVLRQRYTPEQMAALEAGEAAIDPKDLTLQGRLRRDPYRPLYLDDFSRILPIVDKQAKIHPPPSEKIRFMNPEEHAADFEKMLEEAIPKDVNFEGMTEEQIEETLHEKVDFEALHSRYFEERSALVGQDRPWNTAMAPVVGQGARGVEQPYKPIDSPEAGEQQEDDTSYEDLKRRTGLALPELNNLYSRSKVLLVRNVVNQTRLGKIRTMWCLSLVGNGNGRLGIGVAKAAEPQNAQHKSKMLAIRNMVPIRRYENRTIYGDVTVKVGATIVKLEARPPGFGLRASHRLFEIFRAVGIHDIAAKMPRGRNPMNSIKACVQALMNQPDPDAIALGRGKKLVDVRKVYYGGNVY
ncbi:37S ribosomal protein s5 [Nemania sp. FL0916]|nr:37S ribosomal protein s5 [Nemania sp. FL0916]